LARTDAQHRVGRRRAEPAAAGADAHGRARRAARPAAGIPVTRARNAGVLRRTRVGLPPLGAEPALHHVRRREAHAHGRAGYRHFEPIAQREAPDGARGALAERALAERALAERALAERALAERARRLELTVRLLRAAR